MYEWTEIRAAGFVKQTWRPLHAGLCVNDIAHEVIGWYSLIIDKCQSGKCFKNLQVRAGNRVCCENHMLRLLAVIKSSRFNNLSEF